MQSPFEEITVDISKIRPSEYEGPYDADQNGSCANGHPLNGYGRCEPLNTDVCE